MKSFIEENVGKTKDIPLLCKPILLQSGIRILNLSYSAMYFVGESLDESNIIEVPMCGFVPRVFCEREPIVLGGSDIEIYKNTYTYDIDSSHILDVIQYEDYPGVMLLGTESVCRAYPERIFKPIGIPWLECMSYNDRYRSNCFMSY